DPEPSTVEWQQPAPLDDAPTGPPFPVERLPVWLAERVSAEAEATQTPTDLAAMLALATAGAAVARKIRGQIRKGWTEPTNIYTVTALPPGERKSAVFTDATAPVQQYEREEQERMAPLIAEAASEHRILESRLKTVESKAAKADKPAERDRLRHEAKRLAKELEAHVVPESPVLICDDETPESLSRLLAQQGGRMLLASAEGTIFEIAKGRYSETANFDIFLKGHAGDPLRVGRIGREGETVSEPALSLALAVQPAVITGLAEAGTMGRRGFLARFFYGMPCSLVGRRKVAPPPVSNTTRQTYCDRMRALWGLSGTVGEDGRPAPHYLTFSPSADEVLRDLERWLEPQLADGEELSLLAGWA